MRQHILKKVNKNEERVAVLGHSLAVPDFRSSYLTHIDSYGVDDMELKM